MESLLEQCKKEFLVGERFRVWLPSLSQVCNKQAFCFFEFLRLHYYDRPYTCAKDAPGLVIEAEGWGETHGAEALNPDEYKLLRFEPYKEMVKMFEDRGYRIRFATYDWRKYGQECFLDNLFVRLQFLIERSVEESREQVVLACHSMGCSVLLNFLNEMSRVWRARHVKHWFLIAPAISGTTQLMPRFIQGLPYFPEVIPGFSLTRELLTSMPGFMSLFPVDGRGAWDMEATVIETPWKNYSIKDVEDGSFFRDIEGDEDEEEDDASTLEALQDDEVFAAAAAAARDSAAAAACMLPPEPPRGEGVDGGVQALSPRQTRRLLRRRRSVPLAVGAPVFTEQGCVCKSECRMPYRSLQQWVGTWTTKTFQRSLQKSHLRSACETHGSCGMKKFLGPFMDYCGLQYEPVRAGPDFDFYPFVSLTATDSSADGRRSSEAEALLGGDAVGLSVDGPHLHLEELKVRCMKDEECVSFASDGTIRRGPRLLESEQLVTLSDSGSVGGGSGGGGSARMKRLWKKRPTSFAKYHIPGMFVKRHDSGVAGIPSEVVTNGNESGATSFGTISDIDPDHYLLAPSRGERWSAWSDKITQGGWRQALFGKKAEPKEHTPPPSPVVLETTSRRYENLAANPSCVSECASSESGAGPECTKADGTSQRCQLVLDSGSGFEYFVGKHVVVPSSSSQPIGHGTVSYQELQEECGRDPECYGFTTEGSLVKFALDEIVMGDQPAHGVYKKSDAVVTCQQRALLRADRKKGPVCINRQTFGSFSQYELSKCFLDATGRPVRGEPRHGPCQRLQSTKLHNFARQWSKRMGSLQAPKVPTTFFWLENIPTESKWHFEDWFAPPKVLETVPGDGAVTARSVEGPCSVWRSAQEVQNGGQPVACVGLHYGSKVDHMTMLFHKPFLEIFIGKIDKFGPYGDEDRYRRRLCCCGGCG